MKEFFSKLSSGTVFRTFALILSILANFLAYSNDLAIIYKIVAGIVLVVTVALVWWFNQDITDAARIGTEITNALKDGKITQDEVNDILKKAEDIATNNIDGDGNV